MLDVLRKSENSVIKNNFNREIIEGKNYFLLSYQWGGNFYKKNHLF